MNENANSDDSFLRGGLLHRLLTKAGLAQPGMAGIRTRVGWLVLLTYVFILVLAMVQNVAWNPALKVPFLLDIEEACRFLLVGPLLIAAEAFVEPWLLQVVSYTRDRLIPKVELPQYEKLIRSLLRWRDSAIAEILLLISTFGWQFVERQVVPVTATTTWHQLPSGSLTYAFFCYAYFAKPIIRFLWLRWLWQYGIWSIFLARLSSLSLKVMATHPDRHGGLAVIATGHARFAVLALTFGVQAASILCGQILFEGKSLMSFKFEIVGIAAIVLLIFLTPLLVFTGKLLEAKRIGLFEFGTLADEYISKFQDKWISPVGGKEELLGTSDLQSLADLGNSYQVVREMKVLLIGKDNVMMFLVATLLPFVPLLLTVYPVDELLRNLLKVVM